MKLRYDQLSAHLKKSLSAIYLLYGDEPLLVQEAMDLLRHTARHQGYAERHCFTLEPGFDWQTLLHAGQNASLFATQRLFELRLEGGKVDATGSNALSHYAEYPPNDTVLLITAGKLDAATQKSRWFKAIETVGVIIPTGTIPAAQLPAWIETRLQQKGFHPTSESVALLADRVEGNLLAAAQEINKLAVLYGGGSLSADHVWTAVCDSARYSLFDWIDAALQGQAERVVRILDTLREEGIEPVQINWALHRELRTLTAIAQQQQCGQSVEAALAQQQVWDKRRPLVRQAVARLPLEASYRLLARCARVDLVSKGAASGDAWAELLGIGLSVAGQRII